MKTPLQPTNTISTHAPAELWKERNNMEQFPALFGPRDTWCDDIMMTRQLLEKSQPTRIHNSRLRQVGASIGLPPPVGSVGSWCIKVSTVVIFWFFLDESGCPANLLVSTCLLQQGMAYVATWTSHGSCSCRPQRQRVPPVPQVSTAWELVVPPLELDENMPWNSWHPWHALPKLCFNQQFKLDFYVLIGLHIFLYRIFESCVLHQLQQNWIILNQSSLSSVDKGIFSIVQTRPGAPCSNCRNPPMPHEVSCTVYSSVCIYIYIIFSAFLQDEKALISSLHSKWVCHMLSIRTLSKPKFYGFGWNSSCIYCTVLCAEELNLEEKELWQHHCLLQC